MLGLQLLDAASPLPPGSGMDKDSVKKGKENTFFEIGQYSQVWHFSILFVSVITSLKTE